MGVHSLLSACVVGPCRFTLWILGHGLLADITLTPKSEVGASNSRVISPQSNTFRGNRFLYQSLCPSSTAFTNLISVTSTTEISETLHWIGALVVCRVWSVFRGFVSTTRGPWTKVVNAASTALLHACLSQCRSTDIRQLILQV